MGAPPPKASARRNGQWWTLLTASVPALIAGLASYLVSKNQVDDVRNNVKTVKVDTDDAQQRLDKSETDILKLMRQYNDFRQLKEVRAWFSHLQANSPVDEDIPCEGTFENLPEDFHLWVAVEIEGSLYFKEPEADLSATKTNREGKRDGSWRTRKPIHHDPAGSSRSKAFSVRLYAATEEAHYQIQNWIASGQYEKIPWMSNTFLVDHRDGLQLRARPTR